ncbi:MazG family protein [Rhodococcus tukisamuensis]|uniref:XTP/dITP diphosphohydrolase n=1 Tax=Rhodococcus tukisamuensis TaxID=168276 RepID=A0A1G7AMW1_9NOCA|nr:MazG family protein [Rhodococcus tukisamuensis]SDE15226.1 XTP/dITP diphosphohydrolase [Rhodococcus tukisamuensis]
MTVVLLDPRRPDVVPAKAVPLLRGPVEYAEDVPAEVREVLRLPHQPGALVLVAMDRDSAAVRHRTGSGEAVVAVEPSPGEGLLEAVEVMDRLWGFGGWEVTQTHDSLRRYLLEETYELLDAVQEEDPEGVREELGDLLLQVLFHSRIAEAAGQFTVDDVARTLVTKLARRSPHLTNGHTGPIDVADQEAAWEVAKAAEKARASCIDGIAMAQPALALAEKVIERATKAGLPADLVPEELRVVRLGDSAEDRVRKTVLTFVARIRATEVAAHADGIEPGRLDTDAWARYWIAE